MPFYLTPTKDDFNQELQVCIAEFSRFLSLLVSLAPTYRRVSWFAFVLLVGHSGSAVTDAIVKMDSLSGVY